MTRELTEACVKEIMCFGALTPGDDTLDLVNQAFGDPVATLMLTSEHASKHVNAPNQGSIWMAGLIQGVAICVLAMDPVELSRLREFNKQYLATKERGRPPVG